jgi:cyanophycin synthetase
MTVADSRRLTGPSLLLDEPGAILDVHLDETIRDQAIAAWRAAAWRLLEAVGWSGQRLGARSFAGGASLALTAPADALYAATELNEAAWASAWAEVEGQAAEDEQATAARLRALIETERDPALSALREAARARGLTFLAGEDQVSVGSGTGVVVWRVLALQEPAPALQAPAPALQASAPALGAARATQRLASALPEPEAVDWARVHDIPVVLVTGSNGKTTVVRLLAAMASEAGLAAGITSTEGVSLGGVTLAEGDYSGPSGARLLLRRPEVELAALETARGGLLRRGLSVDRATVAVVTNVADDHLGEFGIQDLDTLADVKLLVARAVHETGAVVLNGDDPRLRSRGARLSAPVVWFTLEPDQRWLSRHLAAGGRAAVCTEGALVLAEGARRTPVARIEDVPMAMGGAARHNLANALAALGAAAVLGLPTEAIGRALMRFGTAGDDNPGRANMVELGGVQVVIDYAHNPHGMTAMAGVVASLPARRRLVLLGQAGDRPDEAIRELARAALTLRPDRVVVKDMERYLRGRRPGEVPGIMADELIRHGMPADSISRPGSELDAVRDALTWARPGDVLLLAVHQDRAAVLELLERLRARGWQAGQPVG